MAKLVGLSKPAALKIMRARRANDCGVEWARINACRSERAFGGKMIWGAMGVGMGILLAFRSREKIN
jgi:hypothetical protein